LWNVSTGGKSAVVADSSKGFKALCWHPNGWLVAGSCHDFFGCDIELWNVANQVTSAHLTGHTSAHLKGHTRDVNALCLLADGRLASGSADGTIRSWEVTRADFQGLGPPVFSSMCLLAGGRLARGFSDAIRLWDVATGVEAGQMKAGNLDPTTALCASSDGRLASGSVFGAIRLWNVRRRTESARLEGHRSAVAAICSLPNRWLASGSFDAIRLWDMTTGAEIGSLEGHPIAGVFALCLLADGRLASGSQDCTIRLWDLTTGAATACLSGHTGTVNALCALPDGRLATGSSDKTIRLWDVKTVAETIRIKGHADEVNALCLLADGRLASGSSDRTIRLWDLAAGVEVARIEVDAPIKALVSLAPKRIVAADDLGFLHWLEVVE
jgi:WD40 repeat protein